MSGHVLPLSEPRKRWLKKHGLQTVVVRNPVGYERGFATHRAGSVLQSRGFGETPEDSQRMWAKVNKIPAWDAS